MTLSIRDAAREHPDAPAIITSSKTYSFAECARAIDALPDRDYLIAEPTVATIFAVYRALETARPLALIHSKQAPAIQDRQRALVHDVPAGTAFVLFTSGTTGDSKGVCLSRDAIIAAARASEARLGWRDDDCWLLALPMAHSGGLSIVVRCLLARKPLILVEHSIEREMSIATIASLVPAQLAELVEGSPQNLRAIILGGAAAMPSLVERAVSRGWPVLQSYGLTETFGQIATATTPGGPLELLPGVVITATDPITIRAPQLATQYLHGAAIAPELRTSDLGELVGETLTVLGRHDDVINTGGEKVHPLEVERVLVATPGVTAACVFGVPDSHYGAVVAAIVSTSEQFDRTHAILTWHAQLAPHARPRRFAIVDRLPALPSGKPDRRAIAALPTEPLHY
ncbi:MAG: AMP-binding protein [Kofleriaceae bacterium]